MTQGVPVHEGLWEDTGNGPRLIAGKCGGCNRPHFPLAPTCPWCSSGEVTPTTLSPSGTLWGWTGVAAPPPGYSGDVPFGFGVVELPEGVRVVARLTEPDPGRLAFGDPMHLELVRVMNSPDGQPVLTYAFAPDAPRVAEETPA